MKVKTNVKAGATFTFSGANAGATISGTGNVGGTVNVGNTGIA
jgi:hypothetical protein